MSKIYTNKVMGIVIFTFCLFVVSFLTSCYSGGGSATSDKETGVYKEIVYYSISGHSGVITGNNIAVILPYGSDLNNQVASFATTAKDIVVDGKVQQSGVTPNSFTNDLDYNAVAANKTVQHYTVRATVASATAKEITQYSINGTNGVINGNAITLVLPYGTEVSALTSVYTSNGISTKVGSVVQTNATTNNFTTPVTYTVTAADGSTQNYVVTVIVAANSANNITAFWVSGVRGVIRGNQITVELPSGNEPNGAVAEFITSGVSVSVNGVVQVNGVTPNNFTRELQYIVKAQNGTTQTYTVTTTVGLNSAKSISSFSILGQAGVISGQNITVNLGPLPSGSDMNNLVASFVSDGASVLVVPTPQSTSGVFQTTGVTSNNFSSPSPVLYKVIAQNGESSIYSVQVLVAASSAKSITSYWLNGVKGTISQNVINVTLPFNTSLNDLVAEFAITGVRVEVVPTPQAISGVVQISSVSSNNFTESLLYRVFAEDGSSQDYKVKAVVSKNTDASMSAFSIGTNQGPQIGTINGQSIIVNVASGTRLSGLIATFGFAGESVLVGNVVQTTGVTTNDFSSPITYTVVAADGVTRKDYIVSVVVAKKTDNLITAFFINGTKGIFGTSNTITVTLPFGELKTNLSPYFITTGESVEVGTIPQISGSSTQDFSNPTGVIYKVTSQSGVVNTYTVLVGNAASNAASITSFKLGTTDGPRTATINGKSIVVTVPYGTTVSSLIAEFITTGNSVSVASTVQVNQTTPNNFTTPVTYTVRAADNSTQDYVVTVIVSPNTANAITDFWVNGTQATPNGTNAFDVKLPFGTSLSNVAATFITTGVKVEVGGVLQTSGLSSNNFSSGFPVTYRVYSASGSSADYTVNATVESTSSKNITAFSLNGNIFPGIINGQNIIVTVPYGTNVTALVARFTTTTNVSPTVTHNSIITPQTSDVTPNDFTNPVTYTLTAADNSTQDYVVQVVIAVNNANNITTFTLDGINGIVSGDQIKVTMPFGSNISNSIATFTTNGASSVKVAGVIQTSGVNSQDFSQSVVTPLNYVVVAQNGSGHSYTVTVEAASSGAKSITSFALLGQTVIPNSQSILITLPYGTDVTAIVATYTTTARTVDVINPAAVRQTNGVSTNDFTNPVNYRLTAENGSTSDYVVTVKVASSSAKDITGFWVNGVKGTIDSSRNIKVDLPSGSDLSNAVAQFSTTGNVVKAGNPAVVQINNVTTNNFTSSVTYTVLADDGSTQDYIVTVTVLPSSAKSIKTFSINNVPGTIIGTSIIVKLPSGTNVRSLTPQFTYDIGASVSVDGVVQQSGVNAQNFTGPVIYTSTAPNNSTESYTVSVFVSPKTSNDITAFWINGVPATSISSNNISVTLPYGTTPPITSAVATFITTGESVSINGIEQISGTTANNFTSNLTYTVTAADGATHDYLVKVTSSKNNSNNITVFALNGVAGTINGNSIVVNFPYGTDVRDLQATFTTTGESVLVGGVIQAQGDKHNFESAVTYSVVAADGSTKDYIVSVIVGQSTANNMIAFSINGSNGVIDGNDIDVVFPSGTPSSFSGIATFAITGFAVKVNGVIQQSGVTTQSFSAIPILPSKSTAIVYTVVAPNGDTHDYNVRLSIAQDNAKAITMFSINGSTANINGQSIVVNLPYGTNLTALVATFTTTGSGVYVGNTVQTNQVTSNNFTAPVVYTVNAADGSTESYIVTVVVSPSNAKNITYFWVNNTAATITGTDIKVTLPFGSIRNGAIARFVTTGESVTIGAVYQVSGVTANNFESQQIYTVKAADGTTQNYTVNVAVALSNADEITSFGIGTYSGPVNGQSIVIHVEYVQQVTNLTAAFTTTGESVLVNGVIQTSGVTMNDFTSPVTYTVKALDGHTRDYIVTVIIDPANTNEIINFWINGVAANIIDDTSNSIIVEMPYGSDLSAAVATFNTNGVRVEVNGVTQYSGVTTNDFSNAGDYGVAVPYVVTASNGNIRTYKVTVRVLPNTQAILTSFSINGIVGVFDGNNISVYLPKGTTDLDQLIARFTASAGALVYVDGRLQDSGNSRNDFFSNPYVRYSVISEDGINVTNYNVSVRLSDFDFTKALFGMAFNSSHSIVYITGVDGAIFECQVTNGNFTNCEINPVSSLVEPRNITLSVDGKYAYVLGQGQRLVYGCSVISGKIQDDCIYSKLGDFGIQNNSPTTGITTLNLEGLEKFIYLTGDSDKVSRCSMNGLVIQSCDILDNGYRYPIETVFSYLEEAGDDARAISYTLEPSSTLRTCRVNSNGKLFDCERHDVSDIYDTNAKSMTISTDKKRLYILVEPQHSITTCLIEDIIEGRGHGSLPSCSEFRIPRLDDGRSISYSPVSNMLYVTMGDNRQVLQCPLDQYGGVLPEQCFPTGS